MSLRIAGWDPAITFDNTDIAPHAHRPGMRWVARDRRRSECAECLGVGMTTNRYGAEICTRCKGSGRDEEEV